MEKESDALLDLDSFSKDIGVTESLVTDSAKSETSAEVNFFVKTLALL